MVAIERSFFFNNLSSPNLYRPNKNCRRNATTLAKKRDFSQNSTTQQEPIFPLRLSSKFLAQSAIAVSGLGFIDAGYSGDWSRIGVISKETEDLLKVAAFLVIPLCFFLVFSISREEEV
ncbi:hypothetical protein P3X46_022661 [Hevea brasiliensis]|uniref:DUF7887 domain-containing protein n=1 Tax=Hevea brasiliensis TaxID=3981 RepID=A0ABQ9LBV8_HEVBR|nr:uncharacterized protein LOC110644830 [Hevea brasiliensis]KAJ9162925.1 hypothetical protein P3X46_022661 [Hevea brasiliensis]